METKNRIWFEECGETIYGPGRHELLSLIEESNSLNAAAKRLKISYRSAWGKIRNAEQRLGIRLVEINPGERKMHLTKEARMLLKIFNDMKAEIIPSLRKAEKRITSLKNRGILKTQ